MLEACLQAVGTERLLWGCDLTIETGWAKLRYLERILSPADLDHVRRRYREPLYHTVLERYVQLITRNGVTQGIFRPGVDPMQLYITIAGIGYFYLSNRYTLSAFLGEDLEAPAALQQWQAHVIDTVERTVAAHPSITSKGNGHG